MSTKMTIQDLIDKRAKVWNSAKEFLDAHRTEKGTLEPADDATYDQMEKDITDLTKEINRMQKMEELDKELSKPVNSPLMTNPRVISDVPEEKTGRASAQYHKDVMNYIRSKCKVVTNVLQEQVDADGGFLVPEEWDSRLIQALEDENIFRTLATTITTSGDHKINIAGTKPAAAWIEEGQELTFGDAKFDQKILDAHKLHVAVKITEELLYDNAFNLEGYLTTQFGKALGNAEEDAFLNGDGTGKPTGIFNATNGGKVAVTADSVKITGDNIMDLIYALGRAYRKNASFILNDHTLATVRKLKDNNGAYLWQPSYQAGEPDKLLGYSIHTSAYAPVLEIGKPGIAFGDFSYYNIGDRGTRSFQELRELFAGNGMIGYVAKERVDGKLILPEAVQILNVKAA
jgi:HK97 family phage major capsid protein